MNERSDEIAKLAAARRRLVLAADENLRDLERELHEGLQQHLVALSVELQLLRSESNLDPAALTSRLEALERDVGDVLDEAGHLARRMYGAPLHGAPSLGAELRAAAVRAGVDAAVDVATEGTYAPEVLRTLYLCWLDALGRASTASRPAIRVREEGDRLEFEVVAPSGSGAALERLHDRVEALGGQLTVERDAAHTTRVTGSLPLAGS